MSRAIRILHALGVAAWVWGTVGVCVPLTAQAAPRVQVRGSSRVELRAVGSSTSVRVTGVLRDEIGTPIPQGTVVVSATVGPDVPLMWKRVQACDAEAPGAAAEHAEHPVQTDANGAFCVEGQLERRNATIRATYSGDALHEGTRAEVKWDAGLQPATLLFAPRPERIDLDAPRVLVFGRLGVPSGVTAAARQITLEDERGAVVGSALTENDGAVHFDIPTSALAGPGIGQLKLRFAGSEELTAAEEIVSVSRTSRVRLSPDAPEVRGDPSRGIGVAVHAVTSRGSVDGGSVEVLWGNAAVGAARVSGGTARVVATFVPARDVRKTELLLRYVPDAPYFEPGPSSSVSLTVAHSQMWWRLLPVVVAAIVAGWLVRGWRRPRRRASPPDASRERTGEPSVAVVGAARGRSTWSGRVVDAHEGQPIPSARVRVIAPSFADLDVIAEVVTSADGRFEFRVQSSERDLRLRVESAWHTRIERPLPPASDMVVAMVSRRRALIERLVGWARRAGRPWDRTPEPTPGHVARVAYAQRHPREDIGKWARRLEQRAYGPEPVDAAAEQEVVDIEPGGPPVR